MLIGVFLMAIVFPFVIVASIAWPIFSVWRFRVLSAAGEGQRIAMLERRFLRAGTKQG